jgi:hypothetical protein
MIERWCADWAKEGVGASASVQTPEAIVAAIPDHLPQLTATAMRLYREWWRGVSDVRA